MDLLRAMACTLAQIRAEGEEDPVTPSTLVTPQDMQLV